MTPLSHQYCSNSMNGVLKDEASAKEETALVSHNEQHRHFPSGVRQLIVDFLDVKELNLHTVFKISRHQTGDSWGKLENVNIDVEPSVIKDMIHDLRNREFLFGRDPEGLTASIYAFMKTTFIYSCSRRPENNATGYHRSQEATVCLLGDLHRTANEKWPFYKHVSGYEKWLEGSEKAKKHLKDFTELGMGEYSNEGAAKVDIDPEIDKIRPWGVLWKPEPKEDYY